MAVMHARHGVQRWESLLIDAERLARLGHGVSRAFATDLDAAADFVSASPALRRLYSGSAGGLARSEEHTSELQSLMRISYAVFCLKKTKSTQTTKSKIQITHNQAMHAR